MMTPVEQWQTDLTTVYTVARLLAMLPLERMLAAIEQADAVAPIVDPTLYRANAPKMHEDRDAIRAAVPLAELGRRITAPTRLGPDGEDLGGRS